MNDTIQVTIIAAPVACKGGIQDSWRQVAEGVTGQLKVRYGDRVKVAYFDLYDQNCPPLPPNSQLPVVLINDIVICSGGKISLPLICKKINKLGVNQL